MNYFCSRFVRIELVSSGWVWRWFSLLGSILGSLGASRMRIFIGERYAP